MTKRVVVAGGGIAGLATAYELRERAARVPGGLEVQVLEAGPRLGGNLRTERVDGYRVESGPNGFLDDVPATLDLVRRLGLGGELVRASEAAARRFLFRNGKLHLLPSGLGDFLLSPVLSLSGRLRVLGEPFAKKHPGGDETVFDFAARRIGGEAAAVLVDAMVSGVFAGDARQLSLESAFPKMAAMERQHGGLVRALVAMQWQKMRAKRSGQTAPRSGGPVGPGGTLTTFSRHVMQGADAGAPAWLQRPGDQDITSHVDFTGVRAAAEAEGLTTLGFMDQTYFVMALVPRLDLTQAADSTARQLKTLLLPGGLGSTMKILILAKDVGRPALAGCSSRMRVT